MTSLSVDPWASLLATPASTPAAMPAATSASSASAGSSAADFAKLLALQVGQGMMNLDGLAGTSEAGASNDALSSLMSPVSGGLGQMEAMLAMQLVEMLKKLEAPQPPAAPQAPTRLPVEGPISQGYHTGHSAIDIAVPVGTAVHATMAGKVTYAGWNDEGYGNLVIVENGPYRTYYAHLNSIPVTVGQTVADGAVIGLSGNTGHSTGPHVHYEVRVNGQPVPPQAEA